MNITGEGEGAIDWRSAYIALHSQVSGYLHGEDLEHWQRYNAEKFPLTKPEPKAGVGTDLQRLLRMDQPYCVLSILEKLKESADILFDRHSYDGHGWEVLNEARRLTPGVIADLSAALEAGGVGKSV